ncbi:Alkyl hydroperoxide reductase subunit C/ Thiol specific antioxidant [Dillenia turbinata]|uniref:Peroxiredoxin Q, chloroplastic n=1 Tax=Dillenia turbinata TaxID=194707 RepID=A0AAN8W476_9MAGN
MGSLSVPTTKHTLSSLLPTYILKTQSSYSLQCLAKASHSQFYGLKLSTATCNSIPASSSSFKSSIFAKVSKGQVPPPFTLKDQEGRNVSLSKYKGKPVVVYFYPADETPGCTKQMVSNSRCGCFDLCSITSITVTLIPPILPACAFRDSYEKFKKAGAEVIGISGDDISSHKAFAKKYRLPFTLLSDEGNKVRKEWGVPADLFGSLPGRQTYVLDKNGVVQLIYNNQFQPEKHIDETLKLLQSL